MLVWRIAKQAYALDRVGTGARLSGGRWNSQGVPAIYAGMTPEISALEKLVHTGATLPNDLVVVQITLPDDDSLYFRPEISSLPSDWDALPSSANATTFGDQFLMQGSFLGMIVPSAIIPESMNILINPNHHAMSEVSLAIVREFKFDPRFRPG